MMKKLLFLSVLLIAISASARDKDFHIYLCL